MRHIWLRFFSGTFLNLLRHTLQSYETDTSHAVFLHFCNWQFFDRCHTQFWQTSEIFGTWICAQVSMMMWKQCARPTKDGGKRASRQTRQKLETEGSKKVGWRSRFLSSVDARNMNRRAAFDRGSGESDLRLSIAIKAQSQLLLARSLVIKAPNQMRMWVRFIGPGPTAVAVDRLV